MLHHPRNIFDEVYGTRQWLEYMPSQQGRHILNWYQQQIDNLPHHLTEPPTPQKMRSVATRALELGMNTELGYKMGVMASRETAEQIEKIHREGGKLTLQQGADHALASQNEGTFARLYAPVQDSMNDLCAEVQMMTSYAEFVHLENQLRISRKMPGEISAHTANGILLNPKHIEEFRSEYEHRHQGGNSRAAFTVSLSANVREKLNALTQSLEKCDTLDNGQSFVRSRLVPRMLEDLEYLDAAIHDLGNEIETLESVRTKPAFAHVHSTQAGNAVREGEVRSRAQQAESIVAEAVAGGATNVSNIFSARKAKG